MRLVPSLGSIHCTVLKFNKGDQRREGSRTLARVKGGRINVRCQKQE